MVRTDEGHGLLRREDGGRQIEEDEIYPINACSLQEGRYFGCLDGRIGFSSVMVLEYQSAPPAFRLLAGAEYQCSS